MLVQIRQKLAQAQVTWFLGMIQTIVELVEWEGVVTFVTGHVVEGCPQDPVYVPPGFDGVLPEGHQVITHVEE